MWRGAEGVSPRGPEVEGGAVGDDLYNRVVICIKVSHEGKERKKRRRRHIYICCIDIGEEGMREGRTNPVVPKGDIVRVPLESNLVVDVMGDLLEEVLEDGVRLRFRDTNDTTSEACTPNS